jgi:hypothetical protein
MAKVVAGHILTIVGEFQSGATPHRAALCLELSGEKPLGQNAQILELLEKLVIE